MKCKDVETQAVCLTDNVGVRTTAVAHYVYGEDANGNTIKESTVYTDAAGDVVYNFANFAAVNVGACPVSAVDREQFCYVTTANPEPTTGWARHDDALLGTTGPNISPAGIAFFDSQGMPVDISQAGFEVVPCQSDCEPATARGVLNSWG